MSYTPFLIAQYSTGLDKELQPWLLPNEAYFELNDGYVYRGVTNSRDGYNGFANGTLSTYCESRMVKNISSQATAVGNINGINMLFTFTFQGPIIAGSVRIYGSNPVQLLVDNGVGAFTGPGVGTINYVTGAVSVTFTLPPAVASTVTANALAIGTGAATYGPFTTAYNPLRRCTVTVAATPYTYTDKGQGYFLNAAINISAATQANPCAITTAINHGYSTGNIVFIESVGGMIELNNRGYTITVTGLNSFTLDSTNATAYTAYTSGGTVKLAAGTVNYTTGVISAFTFPAAIASPTFITLSYDYHPGLPVMGVMNFYPTNNVRQLIVADQNNVNRYNPTTDRLDYLTNSSSFNCGQSDFFSWVNYPDAANAPRLLFSNRVSGDVIQSYNGTSVSAYTPTFAGGSLNARQMFYIRGRLVLFQTLEAGVLKPRRIRISGTGANCDVFDNTATGAGFIDIPDNTWFFGAAFNRDDLLIFTEAATWMMKYTGDDNVPFTLEKIDPSRGSAAAFSVLSYLNRTVAASPRGLILVDGYQVTRSDDNIPDFTYNNIDATHFDSCFSSFLDEDRDVYMIYPSKGIVRPPILSNGESDQILIMNFEEDNYAIYRLPLSCMGNFQEDVAITWAELTAANGYPNWDSLAAKYNNWNAFPFTKGTPITIGGFAPDITLNLINVWHWFAMSVYISSSCLASCGLSFIAAPKFFFNGSLGIKQVSQQVVHPRSLHELES